MTRQRGKIALVFALLPVLVAMRPIDDDLFLATFLGDRAKVEALVQDGADVRVEKEDGVTPLDLAIRRNHPEVVALLLDHGAVVNQAEFLSSGTPLHLAASRGHVEIVALLLNKGATVNTATKSGMTPLHLAARKGNRQIIEMLLNHGADKTATTTMGKHPADISRAENDVEIIPLLEP